MNAEKRILKAIREFAHQYGPYTRTGQQRRHVLRVAEKAAKKK